VAGEPALKRLSKDTPERRIIEAASATRPVSPSSTRNNFRTRVCIDRATSDREQAQDRTADVFHSALKNLPRFE
jgi:hypothetical protein